MDSNKKIIALSGGFDPPTRGQVAMIQEAAELGDVIIILNSDEWCATRRWDGKNFLPFKKNLKLKKEIPYNLKIRNSMRLNNEISPIQNLTSWNFIV